MQRLGGPALAALAVLGFLGLFLIVPIAMVFVTAFSDAQGHATLAHFAVFFQQPLMLE